MVLCLQISAPNMSKGLGVAEQQRVQNWRSSLLASVPGQLLPSFCCQEKL